MKSFPSLLKDVPIRRLAKKLYKQIKEDRCLGRAAELGFYFVLSLFPLLIFLLTLLSFLPDADKLLMRYLSRIIPFQALDLINRWAIDLRESRNGSLLSFGILFAIWSSSNGMTALMDALNNAYKVKERRSFWKARGIAILLVFALSFLMLTGFIIIFFGDSFFAWLATIFKIPELKNMSRSFLRYIVGVVMLYSGLAIIYNFAPNISQNHGS